MPGKVMGGLLAVVCRCAWYLCLVIEGTVLGTLLTMFMPVPPMPSVLLTPVVAIASTVIVVLTTHHAISSWMNHRPYAQGWNDSASIHCHEREIRAHIKSNGWLPIVSQLIADALVEPASSNLGNGLLDVSSSPAPRFVVPGMDGCRFFFTICPELLKKHRLVTSHTRVIALQDVGPMASVEAQAVWDELIHGSNPAGHVFLPRGSAWFMLVEDPRAAPEPSWASLIDALSLLGSRAWRRSR